VVKLKDLRIVADEREKKSRIPQLLKNVGLCVEIKTLPIGDYIVAPETVVERKSLHDLVSSVFDGRLFDQCFRLKENYENPVLVVEGNMDELEKIVENPMIFYGAVTRVALDFKIPIIPTPGALHTVKLLVTMCREREQTGGPFLKKIKKSTDLQLQQLSSIGSLPGVGEKLALRMLEKFGTPLGVFNATQADLAKVDGLGAERAKKIRAMLTKERGTNAKSPQQKL
jgi:DNA excision repair protein ERCC-4